MQFHPELGCGLQTTEAEGQSEMAARKDRKPKTELQSKQRQSKLADECTFPSEVVRPPPHIQGRYQVAMGTGEEIVAWLREVPGIERAILIPFPSDASHRRHGPIFWHVADKLPEIVARVRRRRFERLVDELTALKLSQPGAAPTTVAGAKGTGTKEALSRRSQGNAE